MKTPSPTIPPRTAAGPHAASGGIVRKRRTKLAPLTSLAAAIPPAAGRVTRRLQSPDQFTSCSPSPDLSPRRAAPPRCRHSETPPDQPSRVRSQPSPAAPDGPLCYPPAAATVAGSTFAKGDAAAAAAAAAAGTAPAAAPTPVTASCRVLRGGPGVNTGKAVEVAFIGAVLADCITVDKFLLAGGFGRGWAGTMRDPVTARETPVFVKTFGVRKNDARPSDTLATRRDRAEEEKQARTEAEMYLHPWFPKAVDQPGAASARLCFGSVKFPKTGQAAADAVSVGEIFFVCGELCEGGELWSYKVHRERLAEPFAKRIFGQLARGMAVMKHCGDDDYHPQWGDTDTGDDVEIDDANDEVDGNNNTGMAVSALFAAAATASGPDYRTSLFMAALNNRESGPLRGTQAVNGCFHRDLKLENLIITGDYDCKIIDYGSLKFTESHTDRMQQTTTEHGTTVFKAHTPWVGSAQFRPPAFFYSSAAAVEADGYDPASWDVWSAGVVLLYLVGGDQIYAKLKKNTFCFFEFALRERHPQARDGSTRHRRWLAERALMGGDNLFYDTDGVWGRPLSVDIDGIPTVERDAAGVPVYPRLWRFMGDCDPDAECHRAVSAAATDRAHAGGVRTNGATAAPPKKGPFTPALKDLLNRMLDVDPRKRITIEEICNHPWLQKCQAPDPALTPGAIETDEQRSRFVAEMKKRTILYVEPNERIHVLRTPTASFADAEAKIRRCLEPNQRLSVREETNATMQNAGALGTIVVTTSPASSSSAEPSPSPPSNRPSSGDGSGPPSLSVSPSVSPMSPAAERPSYKTFTVSIFTDVWKVQWESDGHRGCATLAEWHAFTSSLHDVVEGRPPVSRQGSDSSFEYDELVRAISL